MCGAVQAQAFAPIQQNGPPQLALAVDAAWKKALQSVEAQGQLARARANQAAAESLWAAPPALELSHRDDRLQSSAGRRESELGLAWPLLLPGQRSARMSSAQADLSAAEVGASAAKLRIAGEVREAAWAISARRAELSVVEAQVQTLQALTDDVERRVRAGDLARADALAVRGELAAAMAVKTEIRQRLEATTSRWRVLTGLDPVTDASEKAPERGGEHPELLLATAATERARSRLDLTRASRRDPPDVILRYRQEAPGHGIGDQNSVGVAVRIPFATTDRNLPREAAAVSELEVAQAAEQRLREVLDADIGTARAAVVSAEKQLEAEQTRYALLHERAQLIERSFRAGETPLPELLRALAAAAHAEGGITRQRAELGLARARLNQSLGILP